MNGILPLRIRRHAAWVFLAALLGCAYCPPAHAEGVTLNFADADIRTVIKFVAGFSHKNFIVDNRVKGKVTIVSPTPIPTADAYEVFLSILEVNGYTAVESGKVVKIIPMVEGKQKAVPIKTGGGTAAGDRLVTRLIVLKHANAQQLVGILRPLVAPNASLSAYPAANMLLLTDTAANGDKIERLVRAIDVRETVGVRLAPLKYAAAEKVARTLARLFPTAGAASLKTVAHQPGNFLVIVAPPALMRDAMTVVERLDVPPKPGGSRLRVRYLKNADAEDVAKVLNSLIAGQQGGKPGNDKAVFTGKVKVVADAATNSLLITAGPADQKALSALIDKLDIRRLQVLVEALIVEISASGAQQFGIEFRDISNFTASGRRVLGGTSFANQAGVSINTVAANPLSPGNGLAVGVVSGTVTFGGTEFLSLGALMRALETRTDANVLSTPDILTMDNEQAEIVVGQNVPFVTGQNVTQGGTANPFQTIQRKDVGLTLRVTPQISEGDIIRLKIYQEVSSVEPSSQNVATTSDIVTNKRAIKTTVLAKDGSIVVLGGLMRDDNSTTVQRVPCIGAVPILGEPFKFTETSHKKTNLMVFLRPHIIRSRRDIEVITNEKYRAIEDIYKHQKYEGTILFPQKRQSIPESMNPLHAGKPGRKSGKDGGAAPKP